MVWINTTGLGTNVLLPYCRHCHYTMFLLAAEIYRIQLKYPFHSLCVSFKCGYMLDNVSRSVLISQICCNILFCIISYLNLSGHNCTPLLITLICIHSLRFIGRKGLSTQGKILVCLTNNQK